MDKESRVQFICECGCDLSEPFTGQIWNYHDVGCENCGRVYSVSRPRIEVDDNKICIDGKPMQKWFVERMQKAKE